MDSEHIDERSARINKLTALRENGIDPYPSTSVRTKDIHSVLEDFSSLLDSETAISVAGRLRLLRRHGGSTFALLQDESGTIQLFFNKKIIGEDQYNLLKEIDVADFLSVTGIVFTTKTEEKTVQVQSFSLLSKALLPLPDKFHGLKDEEYRYRHRYVDLIVNEEVRDLFKLRSKFIHHLRNHMFGAGFMEVETPVLENIPGGAEAEPFITHHNALDIDLYLRISLELHLKRLTVGGYEKIFEVGKVFRNEGVSPQHLQEFTMMEFYWAYANNENLLEFVQNLYQDIIQKTFGTLKITYHGNELDFSGKWERLDYTELFKRHSNIDLGEIESSEDLKKAIKKEQISIKIDPAAGLGRLIDQVYKKTVRPNLIQPCFLINHPVEISPLAKRNPNNPRLVERHQVLIMGAEVGNGFSELNDPLDQRARFDEQMKLREAGDSEAQMIDEDFVIALEHGMPPTAGFGVGIDRLFMILTDQPSVRDVVFFPTMRPKHETNEDE